MKGSFIWRVLPYLLLVGVLLLWANSCEREKQNEELIDSLHAEVKYSKDELGRNVATIRKIETKNKDLLRINAEDDSMLAKLQAEIRRQPKAKAATVFTTKSEGKASGKTIAAESVLPEDTSKIKIVGIVKNRYFEAKVEADRDSIRILKYELFNDFVYAETLISGGFLKPKVPVVTITANQGTTVTEAKSWHVTTPKQYNGLKIIGGFALGAFTVYKLKK